MGADGEAEDDIEERIVGTLISLWLRGQCKP
jgi:hypothetical protein